jgi:hypothetical protein
MIITQNEFQDILQKRKKKRKLINEFENAMRAMQS